MSVTRFHGKTYSSYVWSCAVNAGVASSGDWGGIGSVAFNTTGAASVAFNTTGDASSQSGGS